MDLHLLRIFNAAATHDNMTLAAKSLYISQPALSIQLKKFEESLGIKLFDKVGNRNVINDNGRLLYSYSQRIFSLLEEAENVLLQSRDTISGSIIIGGSNTVGIYLLPKMIGIFKKLYPNVNVNLHIGDTNEIAKLVTENRMDFAINGGEIEYDTMVTRQQIMSERLVFAVATSSPLVSKKVLAPEDFNGLTFISHEKQSQLYKITEKIIRQNNLPAQITMTFNNIDAIKQAVEAELGVSMMPYSAVKNELSSGLISEVFLDEQSWFYPQNLIFHKNRHQSAASLKLMEIILSNIDLFKEEISSES